MTEKEDCNIFCYVYIGKGILDIIKVIILIGVAFYER